VKTAGKILIAVGAVVVVGGIVTASLLARPKAKGEEVYMAKAEKRTLLSAVSANGSIEPRTKVNVQSSVIGEIVELPVKEGDVVRKGDLLVQIDPERYRAEVDRLEATLRMSRIAIEQQQVSLENARRILRRHEDLQKQGFVSSETFERAELDARLAEINLKSLKEQVTQADAGLDKARDELQKTTIRTPIDGIVTKLNAELGEMTLTGTMNNPGTVIMVVSDMGEVLAEVDVDETRIVRVKPGQTARVTVDAIGELHPYTGKVTEIAGTAVQRTGQEVQVFPVKIALDKPDERLRPGMTAKARIETARADDALTVPIQSVLLRPTKDVEKTIAERDGGSGAKAAEKKAEEAKPEATKQEPPAEPASASSAPAKGSASSEDKKEIVFRVESGKARIVPVRTGMSDETGIVILDGLAEGDSVITGPYRAIKKLKDGDLVRKMEEKKVEEETTKESEQKSEGVD